MNAPTSSDGLSPAHAAARDDMLAYIGRLEKRVSDLEGFNREINSAFVTHDVLLSSAGKKLNIAIGALKYVDEHCGGELYAMKARAALAAIKEIQ